jgi:hypothetical protein
MREAFWISCAVAAVAAALGVGPRLFANGDIDWDCWCSVV